MCAVDHERRDDETGSGGRPGFEVLPADGWLALFERIAAGDHAALDQLFDLAAARLYGLALWRTASVEDARDVVQEVFVRVAERRQELPQVRDPRAWLFTVTHRIAVDLGRRRRVRRAASLDRVALVATSTADLDRVLDGERASRLLLELPAVQRDAIYLHVFGDLTFAAVGDVTGVPTFTAASRYRLGMRKLRRLMEEPS